MREWCQLWSAGRHKTACQCYCEGVWPCDSVTVWLVCYLCLPVQRSVQHCTTTTTQSDSSVHTDNTVAVTQPRQHSQYSQWSHLSVQTYKQTVTCQCQSVSQSVSEHVCVWCLAVLRLVIFLRERRTQYSVPALGWHHQGLPDYQLTTNTVTTTTSSHQQQLPTSHQGLLSSQLTKTKPLILPSCTFIVRILRVFVIVAREMRYKNPVRAWAALCSPACPPLPSPLLPNNS